jgi:hypothetical protein
MTAFGVDGCSIRYRGLALSVQDGAPVRDGIDTCRRALAAGQVSREDDGAAGVVRRS